MPVVKPRVHYLDLGNCLVGERADVKLQSHHTSLLLGPCWVQTSPVVRFLKATANGPVFETQNTIYEPVPQATKEQDHQVLSAMERVKRSSTWKFLEGVESR